MSNDSSERHRSECLIDGFLILVFVHDCCSFLQCEKHAIGSN